MEKIDPSAVEESRQTSARSRAERHELRVPFRYRMEGQESWLNGEAINMSASGLLFSSNELLEVDSRIMITFHNADTPPTMTNARMVKVVRRMLSNWPETRVLFGARFCS
jgi:hypothetical protein